MKSQLKKLKGGSVKTMLGEITLKDYYLMDSSEFDQIYYRTSGIEGICKLYDLEEPASMERFNNEMQQYERKSLTMIYDKSHCELITIKKVSYGLVLFPRLDKDLTLKECMPTLSNYEKIQVAINLFEMLQELKEQKKIYCNIQPNNIYRANGRFVIINAEYLRNEGARSDMDSFMLQAIENNWQYWPSGFSDPYSNETFDFSLDIYAVGCIIYELITGKYPFDSKLSATNNQYVKPDQSNILSGIAELCLGTSTIRRNVNIKQIIAKLKQNTQGMKISHEVAQLQPQKNFRKGSSNGILDNISNVFSKMMYDSEGWFLNYVEDDDKVPNQKYVENIVMKMYKKQEKADKLSSIIQKFIQNNSSKPRQLKKTMLLMWQILRKGPDAALSAMLPNAKTISKFNERDNEIVLFSNLLIKKIELHEKLKGILNGNFCLPELTNFKKMNIQLINSMTIYLQQLILCVNSNRQQIDISQLSNQISNVICDQIYDVISMIILSIISLRKDNELQLRQDQIKDLQPIEKNLNVCLKKLSQISNFISAHAIYSLEGEYIPYQQQIMLKSNPYYTTLEYFYYNCRTYKGLTLPFDYSNIFGGKQQKKMAVSSSKESKTNFSENGKNYFKQQINSDDDQDFKGFNNSNQPQFQHKISNTDSQKSNKSNPYFPPPPINNNKYKFSQQNKSSIDDQIFAKSSLNDSNSKLKNQAVSFQAFTNIHKIQKQLSPKKFEDFLFFNEAKKEVTSKPPLPAKRQMNQNIKKPQNQAKKKFKQFDQIFDKSSTKPNISTKSQIKTTQQNIVNLNFDAFEPFMNNQSTTQSKNSNINENVLLTKLLNGLKLKQLKDLIQKNEKIVIQFSDLKIIKPIGSGSAGEVFYGKYKQQQVAIKKVKAKENPNALKEFERQLVTYIKIKSNPNLVSLTGLSQFNGDFYLITQFCSGGSLFDLLHKKKIQVVLNWRQRLNFAIEIAEGMEFLHSMKPIIIHRDLKSLNVFVSKNSKNEWKMKVADFGLSRSPEADMMTTQLGTIHWMAPELLQGKQYSFKVDVFSYGILLWQILSRMTPYSNLHNPMAILKYVVMDRKRPSLEFIPKQCPHQLVRVMQKCWSHEPNDRPTFSEVIKLLKMIIL